MVFFSKVKPVDSRFDSGWSDAREVHRNQDERRLEENHWISNFNPLLLNDPKQWSMFGAPSSNQKHLGSFDVKSKVMIPSKELLYGQSTKVSESF